MITSADAKFPAPAVLSAAYRSYEELAAASRTLKAQYDVARNVALALGVLAALAGILASSVEHPLSKALGVASAICLALGGLVGKEFLTPSGETEWAKLRLRAETLKRDVWKAAMRVAPFDGTDAPDVLEREVAQLSKPSPTVQGAPKGGTPPDSTNAHLYVGKRALEQAKYYVDAAAKHARTLGRLRIAVIILGGLGVIAGATSPALPRLALVVSLFTTISAALVAVIQSKRLEGIIPLYRDTAKDLELLVAKWMDHQIGEPPHTPEEQRQSDVALVLACEEAMSRENSSWRADWLDPSQVQASRQLLDKARAQAEIAAGGGKAVDSRVNGATGSSAL